MIAIIDYGAGNIFSLKNALDYLGLENKLTSDKQDLIAADAIILPGVGAFPSAMNMLHKTGLVEIIREQSQKKPFLGICLGMQMLFQKSYEFEECNGLGLIEGKVELIPTKKYNIPHMGWNQLEILNKCTLLDGLAEEYVYFVHSYQAVCEDKYISAYCDYDGRIPALVYDGNYVFGAQFHPEKSGDVGLQILKKFGGLIK